MKIKTDKNFLFLILFSLVSLSLKTHGDTTPGSQSNAQNAAGITQMGNQMSQQQSSSSGFGNNIGNAMSSSENANKASGDQGSAAGMNGIMSAAMAAMGGQHASAAATAAASVPPNMPVVAEETAQAAFFFLQAALGMMQSKNQKGTSGANKVAGNELQMGTTPDTFGNSTNGSGSGTGNDSSSGGDGSSLKNGNSGPPATSATSGSINKNDLPPSAKNSLAKMEALGYKVDFDKQTFTTPDGKSISASDAKNAKNIESQLNLPAGTVAKGMDTVSEILKKSNLAGNSFGDSTGGGGMGGDGSFASGEGYDGSGSGKNGKDSNLAFGNGSRAPASVGLAAGLTTRFNGELIGVGSDDIFTMVSRRYQLKTNQDAFYISDPLQVQSSSSQFKK